MSQTESTTTAPSSSQRQEYVDVFRGLLMGHMALDHASLMFNAGRPGEELAASMPAAPADLLQFLMRFTGVPVAPGFFFMAGFMVALTAFGRERRGLSPPQMTRSLILRGLALIAVDTLIMGVPRAAMGFYSFMVLSCIGVSLIALALLRHLPNALLLSLAVCVLVLHPLIDVSALPLPLRAVLYQPVRTGGFRSLYPLLPWSAILIAGFVAGRDAVSRPRPLRLWLGLAGLCLLALVAVRTGNGYGNAYRNAGGPGLITDPKWWAFAKYPPDLPFLAWSGAMIFLTLAGLRALTRGGTPRLLRPFTIFGRVPLFFYVLHFYVLGIAAAITPVKFGAAGTCLVWLLLLAVMTWPCAWYYRWTGRRAGRRQSPARTLLDRTGRRREDSLAAADRRGSP